VRLPAISGFAVVAFAFLIGAFPAYGDNDPTGVWLTQGQDAHIQVSRCGAGVCGRIVWLREPTDSKTNRPQVDDKNPNPALQKRSIMGMSILIGMKPSGPSKWSGQIYNADDGKTYIAHVTAKDNGTLDVTGCIAGGMLCGGETWTKVGSPAKASGPPG
jgi:uncharacterized protein (DUF2147 family)